MEGRFRQIEKIECVEHTFASKIILSQNICSQRKIPYEVYEILYM